MRTPRSSTPMPRARGFGTLIGNGWLRESPKDPFPGPKWDVRGRSALRKCIFMPVPERLRELFPHVSSSAVPLPVHRPSRAEDVEPHRRDGRKDVRQFAAFPPVDPRKLDPRAVAHEARALQLHQAQRAAMAAAAGQPHARQDGAAAAWWEDPVALGSLLILVPPIGLAAVWSSKRYSSDARWALTVMTALAMCLMTAVAIAVVATS